MTDLVTCVPLTAEALAADTRFPDPTWRSPDGKTLFDLVAAWTGDRDRTARLWWSAMQLAPAEVTA